MIKKNILTLAMAGIGSLFGPCSYAETPVTPREQYLQWFDEARFGMFIHWGVYAVPAGEWQGQPIRGIGEWIMYNAKIPVTDYKSFAKDFSASQYDPVAWAKLAKEAGMKYVVITAKHHDGFALYDSAVTDWDSINSGAQRDLIAPLAEAVRAEGLKFGLYYSHSQDWVHPGGAKFGAVKGWDPAHDGNYDNYLKTIALPQVKEIVSRYKPAILWWDTPKEMNKERVKPFKDYMSGYPEIINNNRLGEGFAGDTKTPEQHIPPRGYPGERFEVCMTMNDTWGYKKNDQNWKSVRQILRNLSDISSKGGNFLFNVGPTAEGLIPSVSVESLKAVGKWMNVNSEAIYGTTASPFSRRLPWGRVTQKLLPSGGAVLYAHVWEWPIDGKILLPTVKTLPSKGILLAGGEPIITNSGSEGLTLELPKTPTDPDVSVIRLEFSSPVTVTQEPFISHDSRGRVEFCASDADAHGDVQGNIQLRNSGKDAFLTDWKNPKWRLEYQLKTLKAQKWSVSAEIATPETTTVNILVKKLSVPAVVEATGPGLTWKTVRLGTIELPAGETSFEITAEAKNWKGLSLRNIWLDPATGE